jgi:hypothetical protein
MRNCRAGVSLPALSNILDYYRDRKPAFPATRKTGAEWAKLLEERAQLEQFQPETAPFDVAGPVAR